MPDVDLVATKDFSYATRRLRAGDSFTVSAKMAKVLVGINKAELPREVGDVEPPPAAVLEKAAEVAPPKVEEPKPAAVKKTATRKRATRKSAAKK